MCPLNYSSSHDFSLAAGDGAYTTGAGPKLDGSHDWSFIDSYSLVGAGGFIALPMKTNVDVSKVIPPLVSISFLSADDWNFDKSNPDFYEVPNKLLILSPPKLSFKWIGIPFSFSPSFN